MSLTLKQRIVNVVNKTGGANTREIYKAVSAQFARRRLPAPPYSSVRGRTYELAKTGAISANVFGKFRPAQKTVTLRPTFDVVPTGTPGGYAL